jgi:hypothetical protein
MMVFDTWKRFTSVSTAEAKLFLNRRKLQSK